MTNRILLEQPIVLHQLDEADRCAVILEEAARTLRERRNNDPQVFRGAALYAANAAQELLITAGMFELIEVAP